MCDPGQLSMTVWDRLWKRVGCTPTSPGARPGLSLSHGCTHVLLLVHLHENLEEPEVQDPGELHGHGGDGHQDPMQELFDPCLHHLPRRITRDHDDFHDWLTWCAGLCFLPCRCGLCWTGSSVLLPAAALKCRSVCPAYYMEESQGVADCNHFILTVDSDPCLFNLGKTWG